MIEQFVFILGAVITVVSTVGLLYSVKFSYDNFFEPFAGLFGCAGMLFSLLSGIIGVLLMLLGKSPK